MTTPGTPSLKRLTPTPNQPSPAAPASSPAAGGGPKVAAEGVLSALRPDPPPDCGRTPIAWLTVSAPTSWRRAAVARSWCACGHDRKATGKADVLHLIDAHTAHPDVCPLRARNERRKAA